MQKRDAGAICKGERAGLGAKIPARALLSTSRTRGRLQCSRPVHTTAPGALTDTPVETAPSQVPVPRLWQACSTFLSPGGVEVVFQSVQIPPIMPLCTGSREPHTEKSNASHSLYTHGRECRSRIGALRMRSSFFRRRIGLLAHIQSQARKLDDQRHHFHWPGDCRGTRPVLRLAGMAHPLLFKLKAGLAPIDNAISVIGRTTRPLSSHFHR